MKFFIDTANLEEIREAASWGILDGVTTNPSLVAREKRDFKDLIREICAVVEGPISAEVLSTEKEGMLREGRELAKIHKNVVIKLPLTVDGLKTAKIFSAEGIKTNVTLCFSPSQAILAAKAGATFLSPFVGRLDDISQPGMDLIKTIRTIYANYNYPTQIIVASIRHPLHIVDAALMGADICTVPFKVLEGLVKHPLTDIGIARFLKDWEKVGSQKGS
ncbi:MAG TPA: fructose-6-phosphate aldolase [Candidatus Omnitrophota bacterium]|nr:fructose-6-phosphate aldolase [Candidatus Omnitrophota bacterium]